MAGQAKTVRNIAANGAGVVANMISGLVVMPYLIRTLGSGTYGLWILIGTLAGYFGVLDLGVSAAIGRLIAVHRARDELDQINEVMSTALVLLLAVFLVVCLATGIVVVVFPLLFVVPVESVLDVRHALMLVGFNLALQFPAYVFAGFLWGHERFDLQNAVDIPVLILRSVLSLTLVSAAAPLTSLGAISLTTGILLAATKMVLCFRLEPSLRISSSYVRRSKIRAIYSIGGWMSVISWSRTLIPQIAPTVIGMHLGNAAVTTYTVARQLVGYTNWFSLAATQVMQPRAIAAFATQSGAAQSQLFIEGGRFAYALTLFFCGGMLCLGLPFIHWWQHGLQDAAYGPLLILMLGESLPMSQWLTYSVLIGANRQRSLALLAVAEGVISFPLIFAFMSRGAIIGVCVGVALAGFLVRGLLHWLYGCWLVHISPASYARRVFAQVTLAAVVPIAVLYAASLAVAPESFHGILLLALGYAALYALILGCTLLGYSRLKALVVSPSL